MTQPEFSSNRAGQIRHGVRRVLHVIPSVGELRGGPSTMVAALARDLCRHGLETHIATTDDNGGGRLSVEWAVPVARDGVTYWFFPRQTTLYTFSWPLASWLSRHIEEFDIVHIHALFSFAILPAAFWAWRCHVPYIVRPLGTLSTWGMKNRRPFLKRLSFRLLESRVLRYASRVHYTSEQERIEAEELSVTATAAVIPNAVSAVPPGTAGAGRFRARYPQLADRPIVLFLSRLDPKKGIDLLLDAFAVVRVRVPLAALVVAGNGPDDFVRSLKDRAVRLGIGPEVVWPGFLGGEEKQSALADAELFVLPSHSENFGNAVAEAMAAGLAVVVSDQVGIHEEVKEAGAGLVVPCEVQSLADALIRLLTDSELRTAMGHAGRRLARGRYSSGAVTPQVISLYNQAATEFHA